MKVVNWNLQWATPGSARSPEILRRIESHAPDILCLTETDADFGLEHGYTICALPDYGIGVRGKRRKVILWSRNPWRPATGLGCATLVPGRFVAGITDTTMGPLTVLGICIPWAGSRTARFGGKQRHWQDHDEYLDGLKRLLTPIARHRVALMGDFNQRLGGKSNVPRRLREKLRQTLPPAMTITTADTAFAGRGTIDHIVVSDDLIASVVDTISNLDGERRLSDHFGVVADLHARNEKPNSPRKSDLYDNQQSSPELAPHHRA